MPKPGSIGLWFFVWIDEGGKLVLGFWFAPKRVLPAFVFLINRSGLIL
jgi:hypothetical protein